MKYQLSVLSMSWNRIESPLPLSLWELNVLRTLNLDHNQIDEIPGEIEKLSRLRLQAMRYMIQLLDTHACMLRRAHTSEACSRCHRSNWRDCDGTGMMALVYGVGVAMAPFLHVH